MCLSDSSAPVQVSCSWGAFILGFPQLFISLGSWFRSFDTDFTLLKETNKAVIRGIWRSTEHLPNLEAGIFSSGAHAAPDVGDLLPEHLGEEQVLWCCQCLLLGSQG